REALARAVWIRVRDQLGPRHLLTIDLLQGYAGYAVDPAVALSLADQACRLYHEFHRELIPTRADCTYHEALVAAEAGATDRAAALRDELVRFAAGSSHPVTVSWRELAAGQVALQRGDARGALAHFEAVRAR